MKFKVESRIASTEKKYRSMVDKFIDAIWVVDAATLKYLYISPDIYKLRGFTQEEILGFDLEKSFTPDSFQRIIELLKTARNDFDSGIYKSYIAEIELYHKNGSTIWVEITAKFVKEKNENLKIVGITRNIDKRKKVEQKQDATLQKLQEALKEKDQLLKKVKKLESLLPICSGCRRIRDVDNKWWPLDKFVEQQTGSQFTHTICPDCKTIYYPDH
jgi:PAS domain S-box-containing protein